MPGSQKNSPLPVLQYLLKRTATDLLQREAGYEYFFFGNGAAVEGTKENIEQAPGIMDSSSCVMVY
jgi:hypothetical protein